MVVKTTTIQVLGHGEKTVPICLWCRRAVHPDQVKVGGWWDSDGSIVPPEPSFFCSFHCLHEARRQGGAGAN